MAQMIAGTYEILDRIGSGGGGVVFLGRHVRLNKDVAIKADKRTLMISPESLKHEVDILKQISQTYIPHLYDYVYQDGIAYTVIDYIKGVSMDKLLKDGQTISQPQLIKWSFQLLEALQYLHSIQPHAILHGDIKPANIMITPEGDIRLIDFNVALALGEDGAVKGYSEGYASPEQDPEGEGQNTLQPNQPSEVLTGRGRTTANRPLRSSSAYTSGGRSGVVDERSDIYMLGATLYHMISGRRPARKARDVVPLPEGCCDPTVAAIIRKAMAPNPDDRYQTAAEMLHAFDTLYENDPGTKRLKKTVTAVTAGLVALFLVGGGIAFAGSRTDTSAAAAGEEIAKVETEIENRQKQIEKLNNQALEYVKSSTAALESGAADKAASYALSALDLGTKYGYQAQKALTDALGVYDLEDGFQSHIAVELPTAPMKAVLSPAGTYMAAIYRSEEGSQYHMAVYRTETGAQVLDLPAERSALSDIVFPDENRVIFAGEGKLQAVDLASGAVLWEGAKATGLALSGDGRRVAAVFKNEEQAYVYDAETGARISTVSFEGRHQLVLNNEFYQDDNITLFALNHDGSRLAVSFEGGTLAIYDAGTGNSVEEVINADANTGYKCFVGGFSGDYLAFSASQGNVDARLFIIRLSDRESNEGGKTLEPYNVQASDRGIFLSRNNMIVQYLPETGEQKEVAFTSTQNVKGQAFSDQYALVSVGKGIVIFDRNGNQIYEKELVTDCTFVDLGGSVALVGSMASNSVRLLKAVDRAGSQMLAYDAKAMLSGAEARLSADRQTVMLFNQKAFSVYRTSGELVTTVELPDDRTTYDQQFRREDGESWLEISYWDGYVRNYSARDGSLLSEYQGEVPDASLAEDLYSDSYRFHRGEHDITPEVYDRNTGEFLCELELNGSLTYVTQSGEYIVLQTYDESTKKQNGVLLNSNLEILAELPYLSDVLDGELVFDYPSGNIRKCAIYSLDELISLGEQKAGDVVN